jgi:hypothetical protein
VTWPDARVTTLDGRSIGQDRYVILRYGESEPLVPTATLPPTDIPMPIATATPAVPPGTPGRTIYLPAVHDRAES